MLQGSLVALDLGEKSPLLPALVHPGLWPLRTTYEGDFGEPLGDVYFFPPGAAPTAHTLSGQGTAATSSAARADGLVDRPHVQRLPGRAQPWAVERLQQGLAALLSRLQVGGTRGGAFHRGCVLVCAGAQPVGFAAAHLQWRACKYLGR